MNFINKKKKNVEIQTDDYKYADNLCSEKNCYGQEYDNYLCYWHNKMLRLDDKINKCRFKKCLNEKFNNLDICYIHKCDVDLCPFPVFDYSDNIYCEKHTTIK